ncbi:hypothetical protein AKO1_011681 [Acrasis kona]|uniref:EIPR1-like beta-propeller domain-containing protein n=1 Tax=Acrasis kona TaxID=1008807 RepID=A0AAW2Z9C6_9EUKA
MEQESAVYGQRLNKSRCLASVLGDHRHHRFLVGTLSLNSSDNEVHLIDYSEEQHDVVSVGLFRHPHEVWSISAHPTRPDLFFTIYNTGSEFESTLWQMPDTIYKHGPQDDDSLEEEEEAEALNLQKIVSPTLQPQLTNKFVIQTNEQKNPLHCILWDPSGVSDRVLAIDSQNVKEYRLGHELQDAKCVNTFNVPGRRLGTGRWDPHHNEIVAVAAQTKIRQVDMRSNETVISIDNAHDQQRVRDFEYNPNKLYYVASCGDDCKIKFWDVRSTKEPIRTLATSVKFNPHYDQLLLSSSTDGLVNLWNIPTISSKSVSEEVEEELEQIEKELDLSAAGSEDDLKSDYTATSGASKVRVANMSDTLIQSIDEHQESVYSIAWSSCNSWVFGSVSYEGRVLIHQVKHSEKLKILDVQL